MFPILFAAKALAKVSSFGKGSKEPDTKSEETVVDQQGKEHAADSPTGKMVINMTKKEEVETPEMFGGMDLNKIKSALDEDSPIGMPAEVKGGVYKQIFEVNKMMLGSLQRIEGTLKLMLNLEYERALAFQQADVQQDLIEGDTDPVPDDPEAGPGRFRRGLSSARGMLGGAYGKLKGSSIIKLLGLAALIFAFNKNREEIISAMASILEYFNDVYDVFKSEGLGAAFDKVIDDFQNVFFPKVKGVMFGMLDTLWSTIKDVATSWLFGASGDTRIQQEAGSGITAKENIAGMNIDMADIKDATFTKQGTIKSSSTTLGEAESAALNTQVQAQLKAMQEISAQSDGRIQWQGINRDMSGWTNGDTLMTQYSVMDVINANPLIDGVEYPSWDILKTINLQQMGGMTNLMTEDKQEEITKILAEKSVLANEFSAVESSEYGDMGFFSKLVRNPADFPKLKKNRLAAIRKEIDAQDLLLSQSGAGELQVRDYADTSSASSFITPGDTKPKEEVKKLVKLTATDYMAYSNAMKSQRPLTLADQKTINNVNAGTVNNLPMSSGKTSWTAMLYANAGTVYQQSN